MPKKLRAARWGVLTSSLRLCGTLPLVPALVSNLFDIGANRERWSVGALNTNDFAMLARFQSRPTPSSRHSARSGRPTSAEDSVFGKEAPGGGPVITTGFTLPDTICGPRRPSFSDTHFQGKLPAGAGPSRAAYGMHLIRSLCLSYRLRYRGSWY